MSIYLLDTTLVMLVSTIICAYNYGRYVEEAIESVLSQGVTDHEVIVVDNASTDETPQVLARIKDPRLRILRLEQNLGHGSGLCVGLKEARGRFLTFLDADDRWRPGKLKRELTIMDSEPDAGMVFGDLVRFNDTGYYPATQFSFAPELREAASVPTKCGTGRRLTADCFATLVACLALPSWLQTMLIRSECLRGATFPADRRTCPDLYFCLRIWPHIQAAYIDEPTAELRRHGKNTTAIDVCRLERDVCETLREFDSEPSLSRGQTEALRRRIGRCCLGLGKSFLMERQVMPALKYYASAIQYPTSRFKAILCLLAFPLLYVYAKYRG